MNEKEVPMLPKTLQVVNPASAAAGAEKVDEEVEKGEHAIDADDLYEPNEADDGTCSLSKLLLFLPDWLVALKCIW